MSIYKILRTKLMRNFRARKYKTREYTKKVIRDLVQRSRRRKLQRLVRAMNNPVFWPNDAVDVAGFQPAANAFVRTSMKTLKNNYNRHRGSDIYYRQVSSEAEAKTFIEGKLKAARNAVMVRLDVTAVVGKEVAGPAERFAIEGSDYTQTISQNDRYLKFQCIIADGRGGVKLSADKDLREFDDVGREFVARVTTRTPMKIHNRRTMDELVSRMTMDGVNERVDVSGSGWLLLGVMQLRLQITPIAGTPMGSLKTCITKVHQRIMSMKGLTKVKEASEQNLCVYAAAAAARAHHLKPETYRGELPFLAPARRLHAVVVGRKLRKGESAERVPIGFGVDGLKSRFEKILEAAGETRSVNIFEISVVDDDNYQIECVSLQGDRDECVNFVMYGKHLMYAHTPDLVLKSYYCITCSHGFDSKMLLNWHIKRGCSGDCAKWQFSKESRAIAPQLNPLVGYVREGAHQKKYFTAFDTETYLDSDKRHRLASWSIATNIPRQYLGLSVFGDHIHITAEAECTILHNQILGTSETDHEVCAYGLYKTLLILQAGYATAIKAHWGVEDRVQSELSEFLDMRLTCYATRMSELDELFLEFEKPDTQADELKVLYESIVDTTNHAKNNRCMSIPSVLKKYTQCARIMPILSFNGGKYDMNLLFAEGLMEQILNTPLTNPCTLAKQTKPQDAADLEKRGMRLAAWGAVLDGMTEDEKITHLFTNKAQALESAAESKPAANEEEDSRKMSLKERCDRVSTIRNGSKVMVLTTDSGLNFVDLLNYSPPCNFEKLARNFQCTALKGVFPYEQLTGFDSLSRATQVTKDEFYNTLKDEAISDEDYEHYLGGYRSGKYATLGDLLREYNNGDVRPMLEIMDKMQAHLVEYGLCVLSDGVSRASLSAKQCEIILAMNHKVAKPPGWGFEIPKPCTLKKRAQRYSEQDVRRNGPGVDPIIMSAQEIDGLLRVSEGRCNHCARYLSTKAYLGEDRNPAYWTLDRANNKENHTAANCVVACLECNTNRKWTDYTYFNRRTFPYRTDDEKMWVAGSNHQGVEIQALLSNMIQGGESCVNFRQHEAGVSKIANLIPTGIVEGVQQFRVPQECEKGDTVQVIVTWDANALYLSTWGGEMPMGKPMYEETSELARLYELMDDPAWNGLAYVDVHVPLEKRTQQVFLDYPPLKVNATIFNSQLGVEQLGLYDKRKPSAKLLGVNEVTHHGLIASYLRFLRRIGCVFTKVYAVIHYKVGRPYSGFMDTITDARKEATRSEDGYTAVMGELWKLVGNTCYGIHLMDKTKHTTTRYTTDPKVFEKAERSKSFVRGDELFGGLYEYEAMKTSVHFNANLQASIWTYQGAKVRMLGFMYDFLYKCCDTQKIQFMQTDTDSLTVALGGDGSLRSCVLPERLELFDTLSPQYIESADTKKDPGFFKVESSATHTICLGSKSILHKLVPGTGKDFKSSTKGMRKSDPLCSDLDAWKDTLSSNKQQHTVQKSFLLHPGWSDKKRKRTMCSFEIQKVGLSARYDKRRLHADDEGNLLWTSPLTPSAEEPVINWDMARPVSENILRKCRSLRWLPVEEAGMH